MRAKPKKPKQSASLKTWENYEKRLKEWEADKRKLETIKKRVG